MTDVPADFHAKSAEERRAPAFRLDTVTLLPNRQQFVADYAAESRAGWHVVLATLTEANHFNALLRALGHEYSEEFLRAGAARLRAVMPAGAELYHVSILSFAMMVPDDPLVVAQALLASWAAPLECNGIPIITRLAVGIAVCDGAGAAGPLRNALTAAQDSRRGGDGWARYNSATDDAHRRRFMLLTDLPAALKSTGQLYLQYQPKFDLAARRVCGAEALLRWRHPALGEVSPGEFVPVAESTALIHGLTAWVLREAVSQAARWQAAGHRLAMAINVSPNNLSQSGFAAEALAVLARAGVDPGAIEFEFTEGTPGSDTRVMRAELQSLRDAGAHVALDDFGTGFANLNYIAQLPADILKIDRSFVRALTGQGRAAALVSGLIWLAHRTGYRVVAEGIEDEATCALLAGWGCDEGQGYYLGRPGEAALVPAAR